MNYISLGYNCHMAGALNELNLRKEAFPFDFLLSKPERGLDYVSLLIQNNFEDFLENLQYNSNSKVISKNYPYVEFYHHDLLKNKQKLVKSLKIDHKNMEEPLINKFRRRANRFMNLILNDKIKILFFYIINIEYITNENSFKNIINSTNKFFETMDKISKCNYKLIIFVKVDNNFYLIENTLDEINKKFNNLIIFEPFFGGNNPNDNKLNMNRCFEKYKF